MQITRTLFWYLLTLFCLFAFCSNVQADDAFLGTVGGNVFLSQNKDIQMVRENVHVTALRDSCLVHCRFVFYNEGSEQKCTVGFPDFFFNPATKSEPLKEFRCSVDGKEVKTERRYEIQDSAKDDERSRHWYAWEMTFPSKEKVVIENDYVAQWGGSVWDTKDFAYVLGTGSSWSGPIGIGRIVIDHSRVASSSFTRLPLDTTDVAVTQFEDSTVFEFADHIPASTETIDFGVLCFWGDPDPDYGERDTSSFETYQYGLDFFFDEKSETVLQPKELLSMIAEIYARKGCILTDSAFAERFNGKSWYRPDSACTFEGLNKYEAATVEYLAQLIVERSPDRRGLVTMGVMPFMLPEKYRK